MEKHLNVVAILNIVYRSLVIIWVFVLLALVVWFDDLIGELVRWGSINPNEVPMGVFSIVPLILLPIAGFMLIVSVAGILGAAGVLKKKEWGRILLLIVSFFNLLRIPLGTILGGYGIWVLMNDETIRMFQTQPQRAVTP